MKNESKRGEKYVRVRREKICHVVKKSYDLGKAAPSYSSKRLDLTQKSGSNASFAWECTRLCLRGKSEKGAARQRGSYPRSRGRVAPNSDLSKERTRVVN